MPSPQYIHSKLRFLSNWIQSHHLQGWQLQHCLCNQEGLRVGVQGSCQVSPKYFFFTKSFQRDPRASARCGAGAGRDEHHQCGGGRLRGDHHLHPGGGVQLFLMQFQGGKFGDKWKDWTTVPNRLQPGRTRKVDKEQNHPDPRSTKDFNVAICLHPPRSNMLTPTQANECLARRQMPRSPSRHPGHLHCWGTSTSTSLQFQINPGQLHCWGHPSYYSIKLYSGCADLIPWL